MEKITALMAIQLLKKGIELPIKPDIYQNQELQIIAMKLYELRTDIIALENELLMLAKNEQNSHQ